jgi:hypothetical protein
MLPMRESTCWRGCSVDRRMSWISARAAYVKVRGMLDFPALADRMTVQDSARASCATSPRFPRALRTSCCSSPGPGGRPYSGADQDTYVPTTNKVILRETWVLGGIGISDETPVGAIFSDMRAFRLYDGPTEVHKHAIAPQILRTPR